MNRDLTQGPVTKSMLLFALPMILGNLLQQSRPWRRWAPLTR